MRRTIKSISIVLATALFSVVSLTAPAQQKKGVQWAIPATYRKMANPVQGDTVSVRAGEVSYARNCASCHGREGHGDGPRGKMCITFPGDFSTPAFKDYTDGEIFYQTKHGRGEMPAYDRRIPDHEIWSIVNYIRKLIS